LASGTVTRKTKLSNRAPFAGVLRAPTSSNRSADKTSVSDVAERLAKPSPDESSGDMMWFNHEPCRG
jgi:hypothetical protein